MSNRRRRSQAWCRSWDVTFPLPAWETQPLVPCHLSYELRLTSCNEKNLVAMVSGWILMICSEDLLCRGFIETSLVLPKSAPCLHVYDRSNLFELLEVIRTTLCWKQGSWWRVLFSILSGCCTECHLVINISWLNQINLGQYIFEHWCYCRVLCTFSEKLHGGILLIHQMCTAFSHRLYFSFSFVNLSGRHFTTQSNQHTRISHV